MFESNFPVDKGSYSYQVYWNACKRYAADMSATEKADLFAGTAARFYKLSKQSKKSHGNTRPVEVLKPSLSRTST